MRTLHFIIFCLIANGVNVRSGSSPKDDDDDDLIPTETNTELLMYLRKPNTLGPSVWAAGVRCLYQVSKTYFTPAYSSRTHNPNIIVTQALNLSTPAAQIQEGFLKHINKMSSAEVLSGTQQSDQLTYQLRVVVNVASFEPSSELEIHLADYYVLVADNVDNLHVLIMKYLRQMTSWNPAAKFLIMYHNPQNRDRSYDTTMTIFNNMLSDTFVTRVIVMYAVSPSIYHLFAMRYYTPEACRQLRADAFGQCSNGHLSPEAKIIEKQLHKMFDVLHPQNCTFTLCASILAPFVERDCEKGLELRMLDFFSKKFNFQLNKTCSRENRGVLLESGNWSGLLGKLQNRSCDLLAGGFFPDEELALKFWTSNVYFENSYTWYTRTALHRPAWLALYSIFSNGAWVCLFGALIGTWMFWYFLIWILNEGSRDSSLIGIYNMAVSISVAVPYIPIRATSRIFFLFLAVYGLNIASLFTSKLISVFSNPGLMHQISTLSEVVEAGIPFGGVQEMRDWFENEYDEWIFNAYNDTSDYHPNSANLKAVSAGKRVLLCNRLFVLQNEVSDELFAFPENVLSSYAQMIMKPGFPFMDQFNLLINRLRDFGQNDYVMKSFIYNSTYIDRLVKLRPAFKENVIVLTTEHLEGPFQLLVLGEVISILVFFGELFVHYVAKPYLTKGKGSSGNCHGQRPLKKWTH